MFPRAFSYISNESLRNRKTQVPSRSTQNGCSNILEIVMALDGPQEEIQ